MILVSRIALGALFASMAGCSAATRGTSAALTTDSEATLAQIYFWRARPGMLAEYDSYIRDVAEPIDHEAQRGGAFVSVTTYVTADTTLPWTHMRVFLLRDSVQLRGLGAALSAAGVKLQPDSTRRRAQGEYSATLRDRVGAAVTRIVK
jgi:hypothetical protein